MKNGHFMPAPYTLYLTQEAMGVFYIIYRCHHVSFLACLHAIDPHCHKPHQKAFLLPTKGPGIPFSLSLWRYCLQVLLIHSFPYFIFLRLLKANQKLKVVTKNKMDNPSFVDEETIPLVDEDYDNRGAPNTSRGDKISFTEPATTEATLTLRLNQKVKQGKLAALYRHLKITGNLDLIDLDRFKLTTDARKGATIFEFYSDRWDPLTKQTGEFFVPKTLKDRFGGVNTMKNFLGIDRTSPASCVLRPGGAFVLG